MNKLLLILLIPLALAGCIAGYDSAGNPLYAPVAVTPLLLPEPVIGLPWVYGGGYYGGGGYRGGYRGAYHGGAYRGAYHGRGRR
jgi:hypothetical protein